MNALAASWSTLVVAVLWQSTVLAAVIAAAAWLLRRASPAVRYWLWQIVAIKILLAPVWTLAVPLAWLPEPAAPARIAAEAPAPRVATAPQPDASSPITNDRPLVESAEEPQRAASISATEPMAARPGPALSWQAWLMLAWAAVVAVQVVALVGQRARLARLLRQATPAGPEVTDLVARCAARLKLRRVPRVLSTSVECSPFACGIVRPTIVLPDSLAAMLGPYQLSPVVVHELAHIRRLDLVFGWIPQLARILYFFHPVAYLVAFRVRLEGELACDGWAMAETGQGAGAYADLLVRVVSRVSEPAVLRTGSAASAGLDGQTPIEESRDSFHR